MKITFFNFYSASAARQGDRRSHNSRGYEERVHRKAYRSMMEERRNARCPASQERNESRESSTTRRRPERSNTRPTHESRQTDDGSRESNTRGRPERTRDIPERTTPTPDMRSEIHVPERRREASSPPDRRSESRRKRNRISLADIESKIREVIQEETERRDRQINNIIGTVAKAVGGQLAWALYEAAPGVGN